VVSWGRRGSWDDYQQAEVVHNFKLFGIESQTILGYQRSSEEFRQVLATVAPPTQGVQWNVRDPSTWILSAQTEADFTTQGVSTGQKAENLVRSYYITNQLSFFGGKLRTLAGFRSDKITANNFTPSAAAGTQYSSSTYDPINTPQVGLLYKPTNNLSVYAQYSEAAVNLYTALQRRVDGSFFLPQPGRGKGYDIGVKGELLDGRIAGGISTFAVENTNIVRTLPQVQLPDGSLITPADQSGTDRSTGVEVDLRLRPFKGNQVVFSYANTDAYVKSDLQASTIINGVRVLTRSGHRLSNAPVNTVSLWMRQEIGSFGPVKNIYGAFGGHYYSERAFTEAYNVINGVLTPPPMLGSYMTLDLSFGGRFSIGRTHYRASVSLKNLADKIYLIERYHFGAPRTAEMSITASF
jgi:iron complex outermembrane receptor protein